MTGPSGEQIAVAQTVEFLVFGVDSDVSPPEDVVSLPDVALPTED